MILPKIKYCIFCGAELSEGFGNYLGYWCPRENEHFKKELWCTKDLYSKRAAAPEEIHIRKNSLQISFIGSTERVQIRYSSDNFAADGYRNTSKIAEFGMIKIPETEEELDNILEKYMAMKAFY